MTSRHDAFQANVNAILQQNINLFQGRASLTGAAPVYAPDNSYTSIATGAVQTISNGLDLQGEADIKIDGMSLKDFMKNVTLRLNLMVPNPELEQQWNELRTLGEAYRACEKECQDKAKVWDILKRDN
jgi:hypothetical protein